MLKRLNGWKDETTWLIREAASPAAFTRLLWLRLGLSKLGPVIARHHKTVEVTARGMGRVALRSHTTDISVFCELANGSYRWLPTDATVRTIVDLGANTGLSVRWLLRRYPDARAVCVEPEPENAAVLRRNTADEPASVVEACVGGRERTVALTTTTGAFGFHVADDPGDVPVLTMPSVLKQAGFAAGESLDLVKCDIEGSEAELFADCADWLARVGLLVVECHAPYGGQDLLDDLDRNGGRFEVLHFEHDPGYGVDTITARAV